jgi:hypothetical protein
LKPAIRFSLLGLAIIVLAVSSFFMAKAKTLKTLTDETFIFKSFEQVDAIWLFSDVVGAPAASDLVRARVAINGPLALSSQETVYFVAVHDDQGEPLLSHCTYRVTGGSIDTRWWSLTLYDRQTQNYVPNSQNRSSWNSVSIPYDENGDWTVTVSPTPQTDPWLPSQDTPEQPFDLMLRVYNPSEATRSILPNIDLPDIERLSC